MRELAGDDGYILRMDFMHYDHGQGRFIYPETWDDFSYSLYVTPVADSSNRPLHIASMRNGRATEIALGKDVELLAPGSMLDTSNHRPGGTKS